MPGRHPPKLVAGELKQLIAAKIWVQMAADPSRMACESSPNLRELCGSATIGYDCSNRNGGLKVSNLVRTKAFESSERDSESWAGRAETQEGARLRQSDADRMVDFGCITNPQ